MADCIELHSTGKWETSKEKGADSNADLEFAAQGGMKMHGE
jgi:hypothetical protein